MPGPLTPPQQSAQPPLAPSRYRDERTALNPSEEQAFQLWAQRNAITDVDHPDSFYDYRGYWKKTGGAPRQPGLMSSHNDVVGPHGHLPDTFKQSGHPTFSQESQYSRGPSEGGMWIPDAEDAYLAQPRMAQSHPTQPQNAPSPLQKAETIGASRAGERRAPLTARDVLGAPPGEALSRLRELLFGDAEGPGTEQGVTDYVMQHPEPEHAKFAPNSEPTLRAGRNPLDAALQLPVSQYAVEAPPTEKALQVLSDLRPEALRKLGPATWRRGTPGRYADTILSGRDADHVMEALDNLRERFPALKKSSPALERALKAEPRSPGSWAKGLVRDPDSGLILPSPDVMGRWARYGLYGEDIPANWGPLTQPGIREAFGKDPREIKLYSDLWGAISPLNDPMVNTIQANRAYGRTFGPNALSPMSEAEFNRLGLGLPSRRPNINRSMAGEPLHGPKVPRMSGMLQGTETLPPLDEHVTTASGGNTGKWSEELPALRARMKQLVGGDEFKGDAGELRLNKLLSEGLVEMWDAMYPKRDPLASMAASWEGVRSDKGIKSVGGPYDILRRLGLGERGAMTDPKKILGAKWPGGYISSSVALPLLLQRWNETMAEPDPSDARSR